MLLPRLQKLVGDPMRLIKEQPLEDKLRSVFTDAGRETLAKETKSMKGIIGSQPRGNHNVFSHYPKDSNCEVKNKHEPSVR